jgi:ABC-type multidrug transport system fused ATPase/permease subunit
VVLADFRLHFKKILFLVGTDKLKLALLLPLYLVSSAVDLVGIGLLVALISALRDPAALIEVVDSIPAISGFFASRSADTLTIVLSSAVFAVFVVKTGIALLVTKLTLSISFRFGARLRSFLMGVYQQQSYSKFIERNSSEYIYNVQTLAGQIATYSVQPILMIIGDLFLLCLIVGYLITQDPLVLLVILGLMSLAGVLFDRAYRRKIASYGSQENKFSAKLIKSITEGLTGYRESHIFGITGFFKRMVTEAAEQLADLRIRSQMIAAASRYLLEFVVVTSVVGVIIASVLIGRDRSELLTTLALFIVASLRLVPATNQIVINAGKLRFGRHAVNVLYRDITESGYDRVDFNASGKVETSVKDQCLEEEPFRSLELKDVGFRYKNDGPWIFEALCLRIDRYDIIGITGSSGSGKSTMMALILGLLSPQRGTVLHNGHDLRQADVMRKWHRKVSYMPQEVFLIDDSVARNVALGVEESISDQQKVEEALRKAQLNKTVSKMPNGLDSNVGDKGSWLSGGQRQRIALARAFYYDSEVLILDESTSALDRETADEVIAELRQLKNKVTIVVITHQDPLLQLCNKVYELDGGNLYLRTTDETARGG